MLLTLGAMLHYVFLQLKDNSSNKWEAGNICGHYYAKYEFILWANSQMQTTTICTELCSSFLLVHSELPKTGIKREMRNTVCSFSANF